MKENNIAAELAKALGLSTTRAHFMHKNPEKGDSKRRILAVLDQLEITEQARQELRKKMESIKEQPRKKCEKGRKLYAEINGSQVEIVESSKIANPPAIKEREKTGKLRYVGTGKLLTLLPYKRSHFEVGQVYHFWSKNEKQK